MSDDRITLLHGDCLEVLPTLAAESVDAVVTDPPYGLEFMGKRWDAFKSPGRGARVRKERAAEMTPPGKGHTTSAGPFLAAGVDQYVAGSPFQEWCEQWGREALRVTKPGGYLLAFGGTRTHHRLVCALEDAGWIIRDELDWIYASGFPKGKANLKPAHEPIVLARKPGPLRPLGIDECRIGTADTRGKASPTTLGVMNDDGWQPKDVIAGSESGRWPSNVLLDPESTHLFDEPNPYVVGSGATASYNEPVTWQSDGEGSLYGDGINRREAGTIRNAYGDSGGYARFFIVPKTGRAERERGLADRPKFASGLHDDDNYRQPGERKANHTAPMPRANAHPTVKPIDLMRHLVRLVTPPGGLILDPFLGSGTTALAASEEGFSCIGIEREAEYLEIAKGRLIATPMGMGL